jgi:hypothetical protein
MVEYSVDLIWLIAQCFPQQQSTCEAGTLRCIIVQLADAGAKFAMSRQHSKNGLLSSTSFCMDAVSSGISHPPRSPAFGTKSPVIAAGQHAGLSAVMIRLAVSPSDVPRMSLVSAYIQ